HGRHLGAGSTPQFQAHQFAGAERPDPVGSAPPNRARQPSGERLARVSAATNRVPAPRTTRAIAWPTERELAASAPVTTGRVKNPARSPAVSAPSPDPARPGRRAARSYNVGSSVDAPSPETKKPVRARY